MNSRDRSALRQMRDHAREAVELIRGRTRGDLDSHRMLNLALVRLVEIIGEAATRVSAEVRQRHAEVPWSQITSMRNRLIHGYDSVDFDILWQIARHDLPALIGDVERIVSEEKG